MKRQDHEPSGYCKECDVELFHGNACEVCAELEKAIEDEITETANHLNGPLPGEEEEEPECEDCDEDGIVEFFDPMALKGHGHPCPICKPEDYRKWRTG